jgi:hypothetical protein
MSLPKMCSHHQKYFNCTLPPSYLISIQEGKDEFLVGVFCERHSKEMEIRLASLLRRGNTRGRRLKTEKLRFVSTECVRSCATNQNSTWRSIDLNDGMLYNEREDS